MVDVCLVSMDCLDPAQLLPDLNYLYLQWQFLKKTMGVQEDDPRADVKNELKQLFKKLCGKLDALCNFHYTPKATIPEIKVTEDIHSFLVASFIGHDRSSQDLF